MASAPDMNPADPAVEADSVAVSPAPKPGAAGGRTFHFEGLSFVVNAAGQKAAPAPDTYVLHKSERTIEFYRELKVRRPRHILELGMRDGGSMVLWDKLFEPTVLVGLDTRGRPIEALEAYRADRPHIRTYYGRNPDKRGGIMATRENFPKNGPDLIIDDASHRYEETRATFENLFPLLQAGGTYVVEGWNWAHRPNAQNPGHPAWGRKSLANMIYELTLLSIGNRVIEHVLVKEGFFAVRKGVGALPAGGIDADLPIRGRPAFDL